jgi:hypothetical protein
MKPGNVRVGDVVKPYGEVLAIRFDETDFHYYFTFAGGEMSFHFDSNLTRGYINQGVK